VQAGQLRPATWPAMLPAASSIKKRGCRVGHPETGSDGLPAYPWLSWVGMSDVS